MGPALASKAGGGGPSLQLAGLGLAVVAPARRLPALHGHVAGIIAWGRGHPK